ncbi:MAG: threonine synthase [Planctomycetota bacterium]
MNVQSTRGHGPVALSEAIAKGQAPDGGLYMPAAVASIQGPWPDDFAGRASKLLAPFFAGDALLPELPHIVAESLSFAPQLRWLDDRTALLELFHGPTSAFKDYGARFLASCLARLMDPSHPNTVLVATSGDTGAAVAAAFWRRRGVRVVVLYPDGRVSQRQAHQLGSFGDNVTTYRVAGTFDDCQRMVKAAFADTELSRRHGLVSANSISLGRLLPQMTYYAHAALELQAQGRGLMHVVVPTGNLGNALACLLAREAGLPIGEVVLATNANRALPDFLATGEYAPRDSVATLANAMDVGAPSNLERLRARFAQPNAVVTADSVDDATIRATVAAAHTAWREVVCPHTACGLAVLQRRREAASPAASPAAGPATRAARDASGTWVVAATAHPAKFADVIEPLIGGSVAVPPALQRLLDRPAHSTPLAATDRALAAALA